VNVPTVNEKMSFSTDLRIALDSIERKPFNEYVQLEPQLVVKVRPTNYRQLTNLSLKTFEEQRMIAQLSQKDDMTPQQKSDHYARIFTNMTDLTIENMLNAIVSVNSEGTEVTDPKLIKEFVYNLDSKQAKKIRSHIEEQNNIGKIKPFKVMPSKELISQGAPESFEVPVALDNSNFFVSQF